MAEVLDTGPDRPRWSPPRWFVVSVAVVAVVAGAIAALLAGHPGGAGVPPSGGRATTGAALDRPPASTFTDTGGPPPCDVGEARAASAAAWSAVAAVVLGRPEPGATLARSNPFAGRGAWAVVVRRRDGSLARHGAVVTFPVAAVAGRPVSRGRLHGTAGYRQVVWPLAGAHARVRGDLGLRVLLTLAVRTSLVRGRPAVRAPRGYVATGPLPYLPREVHEVRYRDRGGLGAYGTRLGFIYTGVVRSGGLEDQLYVHGSEPAGLVHGSPALASTVMGGNATVAWSPAPGVVAYIGNSGAGYGAAARTALGCLARRSRPLTQAQWRATSPTVVAQRDDVG